MYKLKLMRADEFKPGINALCLIQDADVNRIIDRWLLLNPGENITIETMEKETANKLNNNLLRGKYLGITDEYNDKPTINMPVHGRWFIRKRNSDLLGLEEITEYMGGNNESGLTFKVSYQRKVNKFFCQKCKKNKVFLAHLLCKKCNNEPF